MFRPLCSNSLVVFCSPILQPDSSFPHCAALIIHRYHPPRNWPRPASDPDAARTEAPGTVAPVLQATDGSFHHVAFPVEPLVVGDRLSAGCASMESRGSFHCVTVYSRQIVIVVAPVHQHVVGADALQQPVRLQVGHGPAPTGRLGHAERRRRSVCEPTRPAGSCCSRRRRTLNS